MPSSRAWQCPLCGWMPQPGHEHLLDHHDLRKSDRFVPRPWCDGVPVEVVVTPLAETRSGWANGWYLTCFDVFGPPDAYADEDALEHDENGDLTRVLVVPMPEEAT